MYDLRTVAFRINLDFERSFISTGQLLRRFERDPGIDTRGTPPLIRYFTVFFFFLRCSLFRIHTKYICVEPVASVMSSNSCTTLYATSHQALLPLLLLGDSLFRWTI